MKDLAIIPTYNEAENIVPLVDQIRSSSNVDVLVVDDNSPDGTADRLLQRFADDPRIHLIRRNRKLGLGTAYAAGFRFALERGYSHAITMDADFSHDPAMISQLQQAVQSKDLVIGSRYVPGGSTVHWGFLRKLISRTANVVANRFLSLQPRDCTSGFRIYRVDILPQLRFDSIHADGYSYLVEILFRASERSVSIGEVPIRFLDRRKGKSKISKKEILKAIATVARLRFSPTQYD